MQRFIMTATVLLGLALGLFVTGGASVSAGSDLGNDGVDTDCPPTSNDFATQADAQAYFVGDGGSATRNVDDLDRNGDGQACENSTFPGGSGTAPSDPPVIIPSDDPPVIIPSDEPSVEPSDPPVAIPSDEPSEAPVVVVPSDTPAEVPSDAPVTTGNGDDGSTGTSATSTGTGTTSTGTTGTTGTTSASSNPGVSLPNTGSGSTSSQSMTTMTLLLALFAGAAIALGTLSLVRNRRA